MKKAIVNIAFVFSLIFANSSFALEFVSMKGEASTLEQHLGKGKWSIVMLWSYDCHVCRQETPEITQFHLKHKDVDAEVIGISIDGKKSQALVQKFMTETAMGFPSYIAELPLLAINFLQITEESFRGTPTFLIYDPKGEVVAIQVGKLKMKSLEKFIANNS